MIIVSIVLFPFVQEVAGVGPAEQGADGHCWQERRDHPETSGNSHPNAVVRKPSIHGVLNCTLVAP